ncbi:MAG TPA: aminodeoxychorismate lyase, partial [Xanthomonadales bacterium]|nr:aminodeoxychorismate lyase [Xanthomonadales bacterium]
MPECLVDGQGLDQVPVMDRGLNYGDGLFETLGVFHGRPRWWQDHMERLAAGCQGLGLEMPSQSGLLKEVQSVSAGQPQCVVKIILTRAAGGRGYRPGAGGLVRRIVSAHAWPEEAEQAAQTGLEARICDLRLAIQPRLAGIKHLNRLEQVLAAAELEGGSAGEGLLLDGNGHLVSAISANLFLVRAGKMLTPRLDGCGVRGVLRSRILRAYERRCEARRISRDMLFGADEV